jgi:hypothetical protein
MILGEQPVAHGPSSLGIGRCWIEPGRLEIVPLQCEMELHLLRSSRSARPVMDRVQQAPQQLFDHLVGPGRSSDSRVVPIVYRWSMLECGFLQVKDAYRGCVSISIIWLDGNNARR